MKLKTSLHVLLLHVAFALTLETDAIDYRVPVLPNTYAKELGFGFATNWFKSDPPLSKYQQQNIIDVYQAGFRNLRLRSRADLYTAPYKNTKFRSFLNNLEAVVDDCIEVGVFPIISWIHHKAEAHATEEDMRNYIIWWRKVARKLRKKDYRLSFNLFTELGIDECQKTSDCEGSLRMNSSKYNEWTSKVVKVIRKSGGKNNKRILILGSPQKTSKGLPKIDKVIYENDSYMMAEFHTYASGPNKKVGSIKYWVGDGTPEQRQVLLDEIEKVKQGTTPTLKTFFGAWMPQNNNNGSQNQTEVENFAKFFVTVLKEECMPSALNVLDVYYNTSAAVWRTELQYIKGQALNMSRVLDVIKANM